MKILFSSDLSGMGGGETSLVNLIKSMYKDNEIVVVCAKEGTLVSILQDMGIKVYIVDYMIKKNVISNLIALRAIIRKERPDVMHHNGHLTSLLFYIAALGFGIRNFWTCHGQWYVFNRVTEFFLKRCNRVIFCVSKAVEDNLHSMGITNTVVLNLGIPVDKYAQATPIDLKKEIGASEGSTLFAIIGRYQKVKGQLKGVQTVEKLIQVGRDVHCVLIGANVFSSEEDARYEQEVYDYIKNNGLSDRIHVLGERRDVEHIYKSIQGLIIPSDNESFGMVAAEALAAETPIFSTPNDGVSEILKWNELMISKTNDAEGLFALISEYLEDETIRASVKSFLHDNWNNYDINRISREYYTRFQKR